MTRRPPVACARTYALNHAHAPAAVPRVAVPIATPRCAWCRSKVERQVAKSAAALLLSSRIGATFRGIVTGASDKGTWVRISGPTTEGRVVKGFQGLDVGDRVTVQLIRTDVERGFIDFAAMRAPS
jgi:hypothetical protein